VTAEHTLIRDDGPLPIVLTDDGAGTHDVSAAVPSMIADRHTAVGAAPHRRIAVMLREVCDGG
jgi:hypothetical protein